jgi:putative ABC transport system permease protein
MIPTLTDSWEAQSVRRMLKASPLTLGLRSVTFFGYVLTALLSLVGFASHFYSTARRRQVMYGVMRAMGMSPRQLYGSLILEQALLVLAGLVLGVLLGALLNQFTLPRLPVTLGGRPPVPPFAPRQDWLAVLRVFLILALGLMASLTAVTALLWRRHIHRVLRIGQE